MTTYADAKRTNIILRAKKYRKLMPVTGLFVRQQDVETDGGRAPAVRATVCRFHRSGTASGYYSEAGIGQEPRNPLRLFEVRMIRFDARAAEHAHRGPHTA
jgi:hypothetical protein